MKYLFYLAHPSHFYTLKELINVLRDSGAEVFIFIKSKDILEELMKKTGLPYVNISHKIRKNNKISIALDVLLRNFKFIRFIVNNKVDRIISCASDIGQAGKMTNRVSFIFNDDDYFIVPNSAKFGWPYATIIFAPKSCDMGKFNDKTVYYEGYQKLFYLHPNVFTPDIAKVQKNIGSGKFFLLRSVSLSAHHDKNIRGLNYEIIASIIEKLRNYGRVFITSEKELPYDFNEFKLDINPLEIHHYIHCAEFLIGDSQSMAHEAALLGTPSIRYNDFTGRIGVLEELEHKYQLTFGITPEHPEKLFDKIDEFLNNKTLKKTFLERRNHMLEDMIDVNQFVYWFIKNYPGSLNQIRSDPEMQYQFK